MSQSHSVLHLHHFGLLISLNISANAFEKNLRAEKQKRKRGEKFCVYIYCFTHAINCKINSRKVIIIQKCEKSFSNSIVSLGA